MPYKNYQDLQSNKQAYWIRNREKISERLRKFRLENPEIVKEKRKKYRDAHREEIRELDKKSYQRNRKQKLASKKIYYQNNKERINQYRKNKQLIDIQFLIANKLRSRFRRAVLQNYRNTSVIELLGCSINSLKIHLENLFYEEMSWKNYGKWHIDHIKPCSSFDLTDPIQQRQCFHYTNLQPLWAKDNLSKGNRIV